MKAGASAARSADPRVWAEPVVGDLRVRVEPIIEQLRTISLPDTVAATVTAIPEQLSKTHRGRQGPRAGPPGHHPDRRAEGRERQRLTRAERPGRGVPPPRPAAEKVPSSEGTFSFSTGGSGNEAHHYRLEPCW